MAPCYVELVQGVELQLRGILYATVFLLFANPLSPMLGLLLIFESRQAGGRAFGRSYVPRSWQGSRASKRKFTLLPLLLTASRLSIYLLISFHRPLVFSITLSLYESWSLSAHTGSVSHLLWTKICPTFFSLYPRLFVFLLHLNWFLLCLLQLISLFAHLSLYSVNVNLSLSGYTLSLLPLFYLPLCLIHNFLSILFILSLSASIRASYSIIIHHHNSTPKCLIPERKRKDVVK